MAPSRFLFAILLTVLLLRVPNWFEPYWYGDEGITMTVGHEWFSGKLLYREVSDNKPPLLYLFAGLTQNQQGFKILLTIWSLTTIFFFWHLSRLLTSSLPRSQIATNLSTLVFAFLTTVPYWEGNNANGEIFMIGPVIAAMFLFTHYFLNSKNQTTTSVLNSFSKTSKLIPVTIGMLFSLAFLFKVPALMDMAALLTFGFFLINLNNFKHWRTLVIWGLQISVGFAIPLVISCIYFWTQGSLAEYLSSAYGQNIGYAAVWTPISRWGSSTAWGGTVSDRALVLIFSILGLWLIRNKLSFISLFLCLWFLFSLFGAMLSGRPYPHYLLQITPALSLLIAFFLTSPQLKTRLVTAGALLLFLTAWARYGYWNYPIVSYYRNFIQYASGLQSLPDYQLWFDKNVPRTYAVANWLSDHTQPRQTAFIWSNEPQIYLLASLSVLGKYVTAYHILDFHAESATINLISQQNPQYLVIIPDPLPPFPDLANLLASRYKLVETIHQAHIYQSLK